MTLIDPISNAQVAAKAPLDDLLMGDIQADLEDLDSRLVGNIAFDYEFKINGPLNNYPVGSRTRLDGCLISRGQTFSRGRVYLENGGTSGTLSVDVRKYTAPNCLITAITRLYNQAIQSITQIAPASATQSISNVVSSINTQSISRWKAQINVSSVIVLSGNLVRYNLASALDADWIVADTVTFASCTNSGNNGDFAIVRVGDDGGNNIVVTNASGVTETSSPGNVNLDAWKYVYTNPVDANFNPGESVVMASHSTGANNGTFTIYTTNSGGNNIIIKNASGVAQAGVAGTATTTRWKYVYGSAVASDFVVGEKALMASHTTGANNGNFLIIAVNSGGNNLVVSNAAGVAQGGVAGTANTNRWIFALPTDPSGSFSVSDNCVTSGTTSGANSATFAVKQINRSATNNLILYNESGVTQGGAVGTLVSSRIMYTFASDQSATITTASRIEPLNTASSANIGKFSVLQVNRGGGSNFNAVIDNASAVEQVGPCGRISLESKSIFTSIPTLTLATSVTNCKNTQMQYATVTGISAAGTVVAGDMLAAELVSVPVGAPSDVVIQIV